MRESNLTLRNEEKLLVLVADGATVDVAQDERPRAEAAALLKGVFDWPLFLRLVIRLNYAATAHALFDACGLLGEVPEDARAILGMERIRSQARFLKKEHELVEIVSKLEIAGIPAVAIKGIPLAHLLYRNPEVRVSKDIDILVPKPDIEAAEGALLELGYSLYEGIHTAEEYSAYHFHHVFSRGARQDSVVELHWDLLSPMFEHYSFDAAAFRESAIPVPIGHSSVRAPSLPHSFWHLGMHASQKSFLAFRSLMEMGGMARRHDRAGWDEVFSWSSRCGTNRELAMAIDLCESLRGDILDESMRDKARVGRVAKRFVLATFYPRALVWEWLPFAGTHELVIALYMKRGFVARLKYLFRLAVPNRATQFGLYFKYRGARFFDRMKLHLNGIYVVLKVAFLALFMGALVRSGILGSRALDPERNVGD